MILGDGKAHFQDFVNLDQLTCTMIPMLSIWWIDAIPVIPVETRASIFNDRLQQSLCVCARWCVHKCMWKKYMKTNH